MTINNYCINNRSLTLFAPMADELVFTPAKNYLFDLSYLGVIRVEGERVSEFLQGQLSCDLRDVNPQTMRQGALCNLKGRVLALLDVIDWQGLHLILPNDLLEDTQSSLAKTAMFSKVKLTALLSWQMFGFYMQSREELIPFNMNLPETRFSAVAEDGCYCYSLGNNLYILLSKPELASSLTATFNQQGQWRGSLAWHALQLQHNSLEIYPQTRGEFLPHRLGLQLSGHLSFNKGCYKGQEIIARTHFRAKLKHEMKLFTIHSKIPPQSGKKLFSKDGETEIGELIDFCPLSEETFLVAASVLLDQPGISL